MASRVKDTVLPSPAGWLIGWAMRSRQPCAPFPPAQRVPLALVLARVTGLLESFAYASESARGEGSLGPLAAHQLSPAALSDATSTCHLAAYQHCQHPAPSASDRVLPCLFRYRQRSDRRGFQPSDARQACQSLPVVPDMPRLMRYSRLPKRPD